MKIRPSPTDRWRQTLRFVWQSAPGWTFAGAVLLLAQGVLPLASLYLTKLLVNAAAAGLAAVDKSAALARFALFVALSGLIALLGAFCGILAQLASGAQAQAVTDQMYEVLHAKAVEIDLEHFENPHYYDTFHRAQQEAPFRPTRIVNGLMQLGQNTVSLAGIAGLLFALHWVVGATLVAAALPAACVRILHSRRRYAWERQRTPAEREAWYLNWLLTRDVHAREVRLLRLGPLFTGRFSELRRRLRRERLAMDTRRSLAELAAAAGEVVAVFGLYAFVGYRTIRGLLTLGDLVMFLQALQRGQGYLGQLLAGLAELYESHLFLAHLYEFLELKPRVVAPPRPAPVPRPLQTGLVFDHVSFHYPGEPRKVLDDLCLTLRPGEHAALVGENGAGKTTLVKLLCRFYDPTEGVITLDGVDLRHLNPDALRGAISVVFQDYGRYHLTARENIWLGDVDRPPDMDRIAAAARQAGAEEFIARLKAGYDTRLGKWFDGGEELSVGEWQKVALARAFLRDAPIIVLDEPTSAMDARAEYELFRRFHRLTEGRTALLISHRLSTVRMADRIYVLDHGRIVESGPHDALLARGGRYARLFETQARSYR